MYAQIAGSYEQLHAAEQERKLAKLLGHVDLSEYESVADIGCATAHLARHFPQQRYLGVDPCKQLLEHAPEKTKTVLARGEDLPLGDDSFDLSLSLTALHNYDDPAAGVRELARITRSAALVGVLKKSPLHDDILACLEKHFVVRQRLGDQHDTLLVAIPRRRNS